MRKKEKDYRYLVPPVMTSLGIPAYCGDCQYYNNAENRCWYTAETDPHLTFDYDDACEKFEERYMD